MGIVGPIEGSGAFLGPIVSGVFLSSVGYWCTWSVAIAMIALDLVLRLAMTERPDPAQFVATNVDVKPRCQSEAQIDVAPATNTHDEDSHSTDAARSGTAQTQCK